MTKREATAFRHRRLWSISTAFSCRALSRLSMAAALFAAIAVASMPSTAQPAPPSPDNGGRATPLLIVFDSSGSMWGKLPGNREPKFSLARSALETELAAHLRNRPSALAVFGPGCSRTLLPKALAERSVEELFSPIDDFNPRSKGPLTDGIETALQSLPAPTTAADIIVVHDGTDNCGRDPCTLARELPATYPKVRIHLLSVGVKEDEQAATRCLATQTGGTQQIADDAPTVLAAASEIARLVRTPKDGSPQVAIQDRTGQPHNRQSQGARPAKAATTGPSRIRASLTLGKDGPDIERPVAWTVRRLGASPANSDATIKADQIASTTAPRFQRRLPPGDYQVTATLGPFSSTSKVTVPQAGEARIKLPLEAGRLSVTPKATTFENGLVVRISRSGTDASAVESDPQSTAGAFPKILTRPGQPVLLPPGVYRMDSRIGRARDVQTIKLESGSDPTVIPFKNHGELAVTIGEKGKPFTSAPLHVAIEVDAPETPTGRRLIARTVSPESRHILPAGPYYLTVTVNGRSTTEQIGVPADKRISKAFTLQAARVEPQIRIANASEDIRRDTPLRYSVRDLQSPGAPEIAWSSDVEPRFDLQPGTYRIVARIGAHNVQAAETVALKPFENRRLTLKAAISEIRLALEGSSSARATSRLWEVKTAAGELIWRTNAIAPKALLAPGTYVVRCFTRNRILEGRFEAAAGKSQTVALVAE